MAAQVIVVVCDTAEQAASARAFLLSGGFTPDDILVQDPVAHLVYDATTHSTGHNERFFDKWVLVAHR